MKPSLGRGLIPGASVFSATFPSIDYFTIKITYSSIFKIEGVLFLYSPHPEFPHVLFGLNNSLAENNSWKVVLQVLFYFNLCLSSIWTWKLFISLTFFIFSLFQELMIFLHVFAKYSKMLNLNRIWLGD